MQSRRKRRRQRRIRFVVGILILGLMMVLLYIIFGDSRDNLAGKWDMDKITVYEFDGKGKGALLLPDQSYDFSYEIVDDKLTIDFVKDEARDSIYRYAINEDELTLIDEEGTTSVTYLLKRMKE